MCKNVVKKSKSFGRISANKSCWNKAWQMRA